jgi:hypothetical protein
LDAAPGRCGQQHQAPREEERGGYPAGDKKILKPPFDWYRRMSE